MSFGELVERDVSALFEKMRHATVEANEHAKKLEKDKDALVQDIKEGNIAEAIAETSSPQRMELQDALSELQEIRVSEIQLKDLVAGHMDEKYKLLEEVQEVKQVTLLAQEEARQKMTNATHDLTTYVAKVKREQSELLAQRAKTKETNENLQKEIGGLSMRLEMLTNEYQHLVNRPSRLNKQGNVLNTSVQVTQSKIDEADERVDDLFQQQHDAVNEIRKMEVRMSALADELARFIERRAQVERKNQSLKNSLDSYEDKSADALGSRAIAESKRLQLAKDIRLLSDRSARLTKDNEKLTKQIQLSEERELRLKEMLEQAEKMKKTLETEKDKLSTEAAVIADTVNKLEGELESNKRQSSALNATAREISAMVHTTLLRNRDTEKELHKQTRSLHDLHRNVRSAQKSVDVSSIDKLKADRLLTKALDQKKSSLLNVEDYVKSLDTINRTLKSTEAMYNAVKNEKNTCMAQINTAQQKQLEMRESARILRTEIEILKSSAIDKDNKFQLKKAENANFLSQNDLLRNDVNVLSKREKQLNQDLTRVVAEKDKLEVVIKGLETKYNADREEQQRVIADRDDLVQSLNSCSHSLSMHYEMLHIQEAAQSEREMEIAKLVEDMRFLHLEKKQLLSQIVNQKTTQEKKDGVIQHLVAAQVELDQTQRKVKYLEEKLSDPEWQERFRKMDTSRKLEEPEELMEKLQRLTERLTEKEAQLAELTVVASETEKLRERAQIRVTSRRDDMRSVNEKQLAMNRKLKDLSKKLKSGVSELSMYQAQAIQQDQELALQKEELENAQQRLEAGLPPTEEAAIEWEKMAIQAHQREQQAQRKSQQQAGDQSIAHTRPNAYMPDAEGALPVARPFGHHAPFKPTAPPAHLRHFKRTARSQGAVTEVPPTSTS